MTLPGPFLARASSPDLTMILSDVVALKTRFRIKMIGLELPGVEVFRIVLAALVREN
jgi:hypothetical protein